MQGLNSKNYIRHYTINITLVRFSKNKIDTLPESIFKLPKLKGLSISDNPVRHIPVNILNAKLLEWFNMSGTLVSYEEYKSIRKKLPKKITIGHDSPFYFEDDELPCYTEDNKRKDPDGFIQQREDAYFKGGNNKWQDFLRSNVDSEAILKYVPIGDQEFLDSVVVMFIVKRNGGISNLRIKYSGNNQLKNETVRLMKLSCPYWVPPRTGGFHISGWTQLVFKYNAKMEMNKIRLIIIAKNPLPAEPLIINFEED